MNHSNNFPNSQDEEDSEEHDVNLSSDDENKFPNRELNEQVSDFASK
ncbi:MAG: hypothetical protein MJ252_28785 [archaeon]|nr:hypothetical protein [archaeon]